MIPTSVQQIMHELYLHGDFPPTSSSYWLIVATREARMAAPIRQMLCLSSPICVSALHGPSDSEEYLDFIEPSGSFFFFF